MRKRLRKKKHLGEFRQFGFSVECRLHDGISPEDFDRFVDAFIVEAIEAQGLVFGGGGSAKDGWSGIVCRDHRHDSTTEEHRATVERWLSQRSVVGSFRVSHSWDIWHGPDPFEPSEAVHRDERTA